MFFAVAVAAIPNRLEEVGQEGVLDGARDGAVANTQGTLLSELIIEVEGNPGREVKISVDGGKATSIAKIFLVGDHLYQAIVVTPRDDAYRPGVRRFLDSVRPTLIN